MARPTVLIIGTTDTKLDEILYLQVKILEEAACETTILDVSHTASKNPALSQIPEHGILSPLHEQSESLKSLSRGDYINRAIDICLPIVRQLVTRGQIHGIVSAAGSSGSALATALMRNACPVGFPKLMVSTMASGDIKHYVQETDITMMYSVVDIAGINSVLTRILSNAAAAISAMANSYAKFTTQQSLPQTTGKRIAITMFGNTTPCVDHIRRILTSTPHDVSQYEVIVFHATGAGGRAMERLIADGQIDAVIDLTTTEIPDELFGGVLSAGPDRLEIAAKKGIPMVVSVGACDMVNFGPKHTVPEKYNDRKLLVHNPAVTLMRTSSDESSEIARFITDKLTKHATDPSSIRVLIPTKGISAVDAVGQPFHDPAADEALFQAIDTGLEGSEIEIEKHQHHINDEEFATQVASALLEVMGVTPRHYRLSNARRRKWSFDHGASVMLARRASQLSDPPATNFSVDRKS